MAVWTPLKDWQYGEVLNDDRVVNAQFVQNQKHIYDRIHHGVRGSQEVKNLAPYTADGTRSLCSVTVTPPRVMDLFVIFLIHLTRMNAVENSAPTLQLDSETAIAFSNLSGKPTDAPINWQCSQHLFTRVSAASHTIALTLVRSREGTQVGTARLLVKGLA